MEKVEHKFRPLCGYSGCPTCKEEEGDNCCTAYVETEFGYEQCWKKRSEHTEAQLCEEDAGI